MASLCPAHEKAGSLLLGCLSVQGFLWVCVLLLQNNKRCLLCQGTEMDGTTTRGQKEEPRLAGGLVAQCSSVRWRDSAMRCDCDCDAQDSGRRVRIWQREVEKGGARRGETFSPAPTLSSRMVAVPRFVD